jgi:hypothetical protein
MKKLIKSWLIPLVIAGLLFIAVRPTLAQLSEREATLIDYLVTNNVEVLEETVGGHSQIYYVFEGRNTFVSEKELNSRHADSKGEYIVWASDINGAGQIFVYHIPTKYITQLTSSSTNLEPKVSRDGNVAWKKWVEGYWQIFLFDGKSVIQLTFGDPSINVGIEEDNIIYARRDIAGTWRAVVYSISRNETQDITTGTAAKHPALENGKIVLGRVGDSRGEEFPLTVEDLFLLDLPPLSSDEPETVTQEEIREELTATPSAEIEENHTPESSSSGELIVQ